METNEQRLSTTQTPTTITQHSKEIADQNRSFFYAFSSLSYRTPPTVLIVKYTGISRLTQHRLTLFYYNVCYVHYLTTRLDDCHSYALIINQQSLIQRRIYSCEL
ncbi:hypothetical protein T02_14905 [Trichinella nativa]|uniref:Uncharacterized protein n=1 Tax=Trichinella nativa TaxID=6335 RepID=A0A0V1KS84_9BILA|nr:hypothetical protein T02_14905 [Trichinella nativa]